MNPDHPAGRDRPLVRFAGGSICLFSALLGVPWPIRLARGPRFFTPDMGSTEMLDKTRAAVALTSVSLTS
jgi:hypothetical protein